MSKDITFFLPTRKGSQRVKYKNTRPFSNIENGILELKLKQLLLCKHLESVVLSTNDEISMEIAFKLNPTQDKLKVIERPDHLCLDTTPLQSLIEYVPSIVQSNHIIWGHATTPFNTNSEYDAGVEMYFKKLNEGFDSLISVVPLQNFLLRPNDASIFNTESTGQRWPRTQDLPLLYEVNHAMFITSKKIYQESANRIGVKPYLLEQDKIKSFDIDWEDDFLIAEAIYDKLYKI